MYQRPVIKELEARMLEPRRFIQVLAGPRQVGKTTLVGQLLEKADLPSLYISADGADFRGDAWLAGHWEAARRRLRTEQAAGFILAIDEIQKIDNWSETVKRLWDEDTRNDVQIKVVISGSSRLLVQKGLTESLAGRFEMIYLGHWSFSEMHDAFGWTPEQFVWFGGYPGPEALTVDERRWKRYIVDSLVETSISRDILMLSRIDKPALLRRLFDLGCRYSGMELSLSKVLGQLQDAGNTVTLSHYLSLLGSAGLLTGLEKYSGSVVRQRASSPKFMVHNTALMSSAVHDLLDETMHLPDRWGRYVESAVGAHLLDGQMKGYYSLYYWRAGEKEVDFVLSKGDEILALEVKSGALRNRSGLEAFTRSYPGARVLLIGEAGIPWQQFLRLDMATVI